MKTTLVTAAALAMAAAAHADFPASTRNLMQTNLIATTAETIGVDSTTRVYDEWTSPPSSLVGILPVGDVEHADDVTMLPAAVNGTLSNMGFAVANAAATGSGKNLTGGQVAISFYDAATGSPILNGGGFGGFTANLPALNLAPGSSSRIQFGAGALTSLGWVFPTNSVSISLQFLSVTGTGGFAMGDAGVQLRNGGTIGSSTDEVKALLPVFGATPLSWGGAPWADMAWYVDTTAVPTPGTAALLGLGALGVARRRRS